GRVEVAALTAPLEIGLRQHVVRRRSQQIDILAAVKPVVLEIGPVGDQSPVPAIDPFVTQPELPLGGDAAAEIAVAGDIALVEERLLVELENAAAADRIGAVDEALAPSGLYHRTLLAGDYRRDGGVVIGRERPVVRGGDAEAVDRTRVVRGDQEPALAFGGRIGGREIR